MLADFAPIIYPEVEAEAKKRKSGAIRFVPVKSPAQNEQSKQDLPGRLLFRY
jgi:hypothetical protein